MTEQDQGRVDLLAPDRRETVPSFIHVLGSSILTTKLLSYLCCYFESLRIYQNLQSVCTVSSLILQIDGINFEALETTMLVGDMLHC